MTEPTPSQPGTIYWAAATVAKEVREQAGYDVRERFVEDINYRFSSAFLSKFERHTGKRPDRLEDLIEVYARALGLTERELWDRIIDRLIKDRETKRAQDALRHSERPEEEERARRRRGKGR